MDSPVSMVTVRRGAGVPTSRGSPRPTNEKGWYHNGNCRGEKKVKTAAGRENFHPSSV